MKNEPVSSPTIWQALDDWAKKLKPWQRQILTFATQNGRLSKEQVDVPYEPFLEEHNLAEKKPRDPVVIDVSGRPSDALTDKLRLDLIDEFVGVNAPLNGAALTFGPFLTVIYGRNGAGRVASPAFSRTPASALTAPKYFQIFMRKPPSRSPLRGSHSASMIISKPFDAVGQLDVANG
jgi:hypothetical protein